MSIRKPPKPARKGATRNGRPAHENAPPRRRGDMAEWQPGQHRKPGILARLLQRFA